MGGDRWQKDSEDSFLSEDHGIGNTFAVEQGATATTEDIPGIPAMEMARRPRKRIRVLLVFASPRRAERLPPGREDRAIQDAIQFSRQRDNLELTVKHAATIHDLRRALLQGEYQIVHLVAHGSPNGLVFEDILGNPYTIPMAALGEYFVVHNERLRCVVLNACYPIMQGRLVALGVPYTIVVDGAVGDGAAIDFTRGFYDTIGAGKGIEQAYLEGWRMARLATTHAYYHSVLLTGPYH